MKIFLKFGICDSRALSCVLHVPLFFLHVWSIMYFLRSATWSLSSFVLLCLLVYYRADSIINCIRIIVESNYVSCLIFFFLFLGLLDEEELKNKKKNMSGMKKMVFFYTQRHIMTSLLHQETHCTWDTLFSADLSILSFLL